MPAAAVAFPRISRASDPMVGKEPVLERHDIATSGADDSLHVLHTVNWKESHVGEAFILRTERQLAGSTPECRGYDRWLNPRA